jgi:hypothetical protein
MDKIYQSKGLENALLMQYPNLECILYLSSNEALSGVFLLDNTLIKFRRVPNQLKFSHILIRGAMKASTKSDPSFEMSNYSNSTSNIWWAIAHTR